MDIDGTTLTEERNEPKVGWLRVLRWGRVCHMVPTREAGKRQLQWQEKSSGSEKHYRGKPLLAAAVPAVPLINAKAQGLNPGSGLSFDAIKNFLEPAVTWVADAIYYLCDLWLLLMANPPAVVLLSTIVAATVAIVSIRHNRQTTKLRETFANLRASNWDDDVIKARRVFSELKEKFGVNPHEIAIYCHPYDGLPKEHADFKKNFSEHEETSGIIRTIANDYENMALGIRMNIIDENFAYRSTRGNLIRDWHSLSPVVMSYRSKYNNNLIYIEFEGLFNAWENHRSYLTRRKMRRTMKRTFFH
jgi:hypothetical protein